MRLCDIWLFSLGSPRYRAAYLQNIRWISNAWGYDSRESHRPHLSEGFHLLDARQITTSSSDRCLSWWCHRKPGVTSLGQSPTTVLSGLPLCLSSLTHSTLLNTWFLWGLHHSSGLESGAMSWLNQLETYWTQLEWSGLCTQRASSSGPTSSPLSLLLWFTEA